MTVTSQDPVGLIGLGLMGSAFAARLLERGWRVVGHDVRPDCMASLGGTRASSAGEVFARCELVLLSLPTHHEVWAVLAETGSTFRAGQIIVDSTTGDPASSADLARELASRGVAYLDGTVSGNSEQARAGDIIWMVGGDMLALDRCIPVLRELGREVFHTGAAGSGSMMKLVTNLVLGLNRAALAEGLVFAEAMGVDLSAALRVLKASAAYSRVMDVKGEKMVTGDFTPQARLAQHLKDVRLIRASGVALPLSATHQALLERAVALGLGDQDNSAVIEALRRVSQHD